MYVESIVYNHVKAMVTTALAGGAPVDADGLSDRMRKWPQETEELLDNLADGGLLRACEKPAVGTRRSFRLARPLEDIGLDEIARIVRPGVSSEVTPPTKAAGITWELINTLQQYTEDLLAQFKLADLLVFEADTGVDHAAETAALKGLSPARPGLSVADLRNLMHARQLPVVIDVRASGFAHWPVPPWARWIALEHLSDYVYDWPRSTPIITVCQVGVRSLIAAGYLRLQGFTDVRPLIGGLEAWHGVKMQS